MVYVQRNIKKSIVVILDNDLRLFNSVRCFFKSSFISFILLILFEILDNNVFIHICNILLGKKDTVGVLS